MLTLNMEHGLIIPIKPPPPTADKAYKFGSGMRALRSIWGIRLIVCILLVSMMPVFVLPMVRKGSSDSLGRYADWLRTQFEETNKDAVDYALAVARGQDVSDIDAFLDVFVDALNLYQGAGAISVPHHSFWRAFQFEWLSLVGNAVTPHWILKSTQARTLLSQERNPVALRPCLQLKSRVGEVVARQNWSAQHLFAAVVSFASISPRAP